MRNKLTLKTGFAHIWAHSQKYYYKYPCIQRFSDFQIQLYSLSVWSEHCIRLYVELIHSIFVVLVNTCMLSENLPMHG